MRLPIAAASTLFVVVVAAACGGGGGGPKAQPCPKTNRVGTKDVVKFIPQCAEIKAGDTVTWTNNDGVPHTVTFTAKGEGFDKYFEKGEKVERVFDKAGTYEYYCKVHGSVMSGTIKVAEA